MATDRSTVGLEHHTVVPEDPPVMGVDHLTVVPENDGAATERDE